MSRAGPPARILVVDDHPIVREGLRARLVLHDDLDVCGEAGDEASAFRLAEELRPDLAIVDLSLSSGDGLGLIRRLRAHLPDLKILVHSMHDERHYGERSLGAGASGYVGKHEAQETLVDAVRAVLRGEMYLSRELTDHVVRGRVGHRPGEEEDRIRRLSDRELEVLSLIGRGLSTRAIAERLHLSIHTIDTYRERLKVKLELRDGAELSRRAVEWTLGNM